ncbi:ComEC/Rec2 family competence protein [Streptomyces sp. NPDC018833]|uniref:ComEC/Rec2 family competence protein n=1 Tax=Streptomyces sp. NPDC018833 TaxID=3365053 RepID=UPI0037891254
MTCATVHAASVNRLGAADPRPEGPIDLRLVLPALAAWGAAALAVAAPGWWTATGVAACLVAAGTIALAVIAQRRVRARAGVPYGPEASGSVPRAPEAGGWLLRLNATAAVAVLLCAAAGAASAGLHGADLRRGPLPGLARHRAHVTLELTVTSDPRPVRPRVVGNRLAPGVTVLNAEATRVTGPGAVNTDMRTPILVMVPAGRAATEWQRLLPSTRLRLTGRLVPPLRPDDRIAAVLRTEGSGPPRITGPPTALQRLAGDLRAGLREASDGLAPDARALLPGLVVGDTSRVPEDLHEAFEATDLTHLLAVSGSNLTIILILLVGPPGRALLAERGGMAPRLGITLRGTALLGGALTLAFVVVCRPEPSVLRAAACGLVTLLAIGTGRRRSLIPALAAAVLLLVLYDPWLARSYGFLLSVLATGALLTIAPGWSAALQRRRVPPRLAEALAAAAAAQAVCGPVVAVFAARVSLVAIPCNLVAEVAVAPATILGFAALAAAPVVIPVAGVLALCAGWPAGWIAQVARTGAALPGADAEWPDGWAGGLLLAAVTAVVLLLVRRLPRHPLVGAVCALLMLFFVLRPPPLTRVISGWPPPEWNYVMCDVGQGDATVLAAGSGTAVVVDAGPDPELADRCLRDLGVTRIPLLLITHFHADHVAGLPGALKGRSVGVIQTTRLQEPPGQAAFVRRVAAEAGVPIAHAAQGEHRRTGGIDWQVLWPDHRQGTRPQGPNDASVALLVRAAGGLSLLLLGDLEPPAQQALLRAHPAIPRVDVLKVAHHGSAYQHPGLLAAIRPRLALISCGRDNPYGHPAPVTVGMLRARGAMVLRTDRDGAIAVAGAGPRLRVTTRAGPAEH